MAQNTMNTNSKDVVKSVESTSNEQRQTVKPIVISRRRLLRAGVAGIPVVLTMAGVAPGIEGVNAASAASGMNYDGLGTVDRISQKVAPDNGLIWSDVDGFVLTEQNGDYFTLQDGLVSTAATPTATVTGLTFTADDNPDTSKDVTLTLNLVAGAISGNPRLHKFGNYYISVEDVSFASALTSSDLSGSVEGSVLTVTLDNTKPATFDLSNWGTASDHNGTNWYCLTEGNATSNKNIKSVTIKVASLSYSVTSGEGADATTITYTCAPQGGIDFTFTNIPVELPTKLN